MRKVVVHIGIHKTGTTFMQRYYFPNLKNTMYYSGDFFNNFGYNTMPENLLISREGLSGKPWNNGWLKGVENNFHWIDSFKIAVKNLKKVFPEAHIIIMFRKHGDLLISLYKQYIQEGGILKFDDFYNEGAGGVVRNEDLNFEQRVKFLKEQFSNVDVLSFENFKAEGVSYLNRYFLDIGIENKELPRRSKGNKSISGKKIVLLRKVNKYYSATPEIFQKILNRTKLSPRHIFQSHLQFWKSEDSKQYSEKKDLINKRFIEDWKVIENISWK